MIDGNCWQMAALLVCGCWVLSALIESASDYAKAAEAGGEGTAFDVDSAFPGTVTVMWTADPADVSGRGDTFIRHLSSMLDKLSEGGATRAREAVLASFPFRRYWGWTMGEEIDPDKEVDLKTIKEFATSMLQHSNSREVSMGVLGPLRETFMEYKTDMKAAYAQRHHPTLTTPPVDTPTQGDLKNIRDADSGSTYREVTKARPIDEAAGGSLPPGPSVIEDRTTHSLSGGKGDKTDTTKPDDSKPDGASDSDTTVEKQPATEYS
eukprot:GHVU01194205.1.p1 GENE.GHVU01194205.1~~GHVU01194205.1.p1  ORF type:complete len:265 (-),score=30.45 GHVU01194205.1:9-803(-)